ncbi:MAG: hypothetical protein ACKVQR_10905 [Aquabacterium sp.]
MRRRAVQLEPTIATLSIHTSVWNTSSFSAEAPDPTLELALLREHLAHCQGGHGRLFRLQCVAEALDVYLSARLVTVLVVASMALGAASTLL